jgi:hypothetical protein
MQKTTRTVPHFILCRRDEAGERISHDFLTVASPSGIPGAQMGFLFTSARKAARFSQAARLRKWTPERLDYFSLYFWLKDAHELERVELIASNARWDASGPVTVFDVSTLLGSISPRKAGNAEAESIEAEGHTLAVSLEPVGQA